MAVYEDDPRVKPKLQSYGGSTSRGSAKRGEPKKSTGSVSWESGQRRKNAEAAQKDWEKGGVPGAPAKEVPRRDPRMPTRPRAPGPDRQDFSRLPWSPPAPTPLNYHLKESEPWKDAALHKVMEALSPGAALLEKYDRSKNPTKPSWEDLLRSLEQGMKRKRFNEGGDKGIQAKPQPGPKAVQPPMFRMGQLPQWSGET